MTSTLRTFVIVGLFMVATAAITAITITKWNLFAPKDYEECAERAARDAKSKDALGILISVCRSNFGGRRKTGGGYTYYDQCQDQTFDINGPNPTKDEMNYMSDQCRAHLDQKSRMDVEETESKRKAQQVAQEAKAKSQEAAEQAAVAALAVLRARKMAAIPTIQVIRTGYSDDCILLDVCGMKVEVTNGSKESLSYITVGLSNVRGSGDACPSAYATQKTVSVYLSPGERRGATIDFVDKEFWNHPICMKVLDVQFAGR